MPAGLHQDHGDIHADGWSSGVVEVANHLGGGNCDGAHSLGLGGGHGPGDLGDTRGYAPVHLALESLEDLGPPPPPHRLCRDRSSVVHDERVGPVGERIRFRFVVVGVVGSVLIAARAGSKSANAEAVQHRLAIALRSLRQRGAHRLRPGDLPKLRRHGEQGYRRQKDAQPSRLGDLWHE